MVEKDKVEKIDKDKIDYNTDLEYLLKIHAEECESFSILHRYSYEKYNERSNYINIPVIILSSAIGFATGIDIGYDRMNIILGVSSIFVGIIKSIDTYFQLGKRSESHRLCSLQFQQINKKVMIELSLKRLQRISAKDMLQIIKTDIKNLQDIAPLIDEDIITLFKKNYGEPDAVSGKVTFNAHTPNLCNGLTEVIVNGDEIINPQNNGADGQGRRRRRNSRERRRSRGSSPDSYGSGGDDDRGGGGGGGVTNYIQGSRGNGNGSGRNSRQEHGHGHGDGHGNGNRDNTPQDGNVSSGSNGSGFISSVSNFIKEGVNLITGNRSRPPSANSNSNPSQRVINQNEYRERRKKNREMSGSSDKAENSENFNSNTDKLKQVVNDISNKQESTNEIIELTDAVSYSGQQVGLNVNPVAVSTSTPLSTPGHHTPMLQIHSGIQSRASIQRPSPQVLHSEQLQQLQHLQQLQQLQQMQNVQQYFNSQSQSKPPTPAPAPAPLAIPQLSSVGLGTGKSTPVVFPSSASQKSNKSNAPNIQLSTDNVLSAVSASLVYVGSTGNISQNITPAVSKPGSVKGDIEPVVVANAISNITIPDIGNIDEVESNNVVIDILPLTQTNLNIHESMLQAQLHTEPQIQTHLIPESQTQQPSVNATLQSLILNQNDADYDPEGMM
jgi:hypothetical protein